MSTSRSHFRAIESCWQLGMWYGTFHSCQPFLTLPYLTLPVPVIKSTQRKCRLLLRNFKEIPAPTMRQWLRPVAGDWLGKNGTPTSSLHPVWHYQKKMFFGICCCQSWGMFTDVYFEKSDVKSSDFKSKQNGTVVWIFSVCLWEADLSTCWEGKA